MKRGLASGDVGIAVFGEPGKGLLSAFGFHAQPLSAWRDSLDKTKDRSCDRFRRLHALRLFTRECEGSHSRPRCTGINDMDAKTAGKFGLVCIGAKQSLERSLG